MFVFFCTVEKNKKICILEDKIAELQKNEKERDADFENTLESKEQLLLKAKKVASVFKRKLLRNEEETKDLNTELISMKGTNNLYICTFTNCRTHEREPCRCR